MSLCWDAARPWSIAACPWGKCDFTLFPTSCPRQPRNCFPAATVTSHHFLFASRLGNDLLMKAVMRVGWCSVSCQPSSLGRMRLWPIHP